MTEVLMRLKSGTSRMVLLAALAATCFCACNRSKEPAITGRSSDPPVALRPKWQLNQRYVYRVDAVTTSQVPRRNTKNMIRAEVTLGQEIALTVTNTAADGSHVLLMELLTVQMESGTQDSVSAAYDSETPSMFSDETPLTQRLDKLKGLKLVFHVTPENTIKRVDGTKDLNTRMNSGSSVRGVAGGVISRFFGVQFYRELIEMSMLPKNPVRPGEQWKVTRPPGLGLSGSGSLLEMTYTFKGWQMHDGTNCARIDFEGLFKPNQGRTNQNLVRQVINSVVPANTDTGTVKGRTWYEPELGLAVETILEQDLKSTTTTVRRPRVSVTRTNAPAPVVTAADPAPADTVALESPATTNVAVAPPPPPPAASNAPPPTITTTSTALQQHIVIKLVELTTVEAPAK